MFGLCCMLCHSVCCHVTVVLNHDMLVMSLCYATVVVIRLKLNQSHHLINAHNMFRGCLLVSNDQYVTLICAGSRDQEGGIRLWLKSI